MTQLVAIKFMLKSGHFVIAVVPLAAGLDIVSKFHHKNYPDGARLGNSEVVADTWAWSVSMDDVVAVHTLDADTIMLQQRMERQQVRQMSEQAPKQNPYQNPFGPKFSGN